MNRTHIAFAVFAGMLLASAATVQGLINPKFTPINLMEQAQSAAVVTLKPGANDKLINVEVNSIIRPKGGEKKNFVVDLSNSPKPAMAEEVGKWVKAHPNQKALFFTGDFKEADGGKEFASGYIHISGRWVSLAKGDKEGVQDMKDIDDRMQACWAGGTDMLEKEIEYLLSDDSPNIPVTAEAFWNDEIKNFDKVAGKACGAVAVDLTDGLPQALFVGSAGGDRLYTWDEAAGSLADVTAKRKLASKSQAFVWGDFNRDGKADLASFDGKEITLHLQQADGTFKADAVVAKGECLGLAVVDAGKGQAGLVINTGKVPQIASTDGKAWSTKTLGGAVPATRPDMAKPGSVLVADLDGDQQADVLQMFSGMGLFYKGEGDGKFADGKLVGIGQGQGVSKSWLGDFDGDGLLDVFTVAEDRCRLWHNRGGVQFEEAIDLSGEVAYISKPGATDGMTCDFNNDGRQDLLLLYAKDESPQLFFNRGFRSTGHAHDLDIREKQILTEAEKGVQAGCMGDFNGDGAQDMAIVLLDGEGRLLLRKVAEGESALSVRVSLPGTGKVAGPVNVIGYNNKRCLGAWPVTAGSTSAFIAQQISATVKLEWQLPGAKKQTKDVDLAEKPLRLVIEEK